MRNSFNWYIKMQTLPFLHSPLNIVYHDLCYIHIDHCNDNIVNTSSYALNSQHLQTFDGNYFFGSNEAFISISFITVAFFKTYFS